MLPDTVMAIEPDCSSTPEGAHVWPLLQQPLFLSVAESETGPAVSPSAVNMVLTAVCAAAGSGIVTVGKFTHAGLAS